MRKQQSSNNQSIKLEGILTKRNEKYQNQEFNSSDRFFSTIIEMKNFDTSINLMKRQRFFGSLRVKNKDIQKNVSQLNCFSKEQNLQKDHLNQSTNIIGQNDTKQQQEEEYLGQQVIKIKDDCNIPLQSPENDFKKNEDDRIINQEQNLNSLDQSPIKEVQQDAENQAQHENFNSYIGSTIPNCPIIVSFILYPNNGNSQFLYMPFNQINLDYIFNYYKSIITPFQYFPLLQTPLYQNLQEYILQAKQKNDTETKIAQ